MDYMECEGFMCSESDKDKLDRVLFFRNLEINRRVLVILI